MYDYVRTIQYDLATIANRQDIKLYTAHVCMYKFMYV